MAEMINGGKLTKDQAKAMEDLSYPEVKKIVKGKAKAIWDEKKKDIIVVAKRKFMQARGPSTTAGVVLTALVLVVGILFVTTGFVANTVAENDLTVPGLNEEEWKTTRGYAVYELRTEAKVMNGTYAITVNNKTSIYDIQKVIDKNDDKFIDIKVSLLDVLFENATMEVEVHIWLDTNPTTEIVHKSTLIRVYENEWLRNLMLFSGIGIIWIAGGLTWTGAKGRDPYEVSQTKFKG